MICLSRSYHFRFSKGRLPQILLSPFLNSLTHLCKLNHYSLPLFLKYLTISLPRFFGTCTKTVKKNYLEEIFRINSNVFGLLATATFPWNHKLILTYIRHLYDLLSAISFIKGALFIGWNLLWYFSFV